MSEEKPIKMKAVIILPKGQMSKKDIQRLNDNHFCVVEAKDPSAVRMMEPPPNGYSEQEKAAIKLCRYVMARPGGSSFFKSELSEVMVKFFLEGSPMEAPAQVAPVKQPR